MSGIPVVSLSTCAPSRLQVAHVFGASTSQRYLYWHLIGHAWLLFWVASEAVSYLACTVDSLCLQDGIGSWRT